MARTVLTPIEAFCWLANAPDKSAVVLECGAGKGEVSQFMARHFGRAICSDINAGYLPTPFGPLEVLVAAAEEVPLPDNSVDLLVSVQALHHFDKERHLAEARRLLGPGGVFAALCWGDIQLPSDVAGAYQDTFRALEPYWESARPWVLSGYSGLAFAGEEIRLPETRMNRRLSQEQLGMIIAQWSATQVALAENADIPEPLACSRDWPAGIPVSWPLLGKVFKL
ncbi:class I SAM-dependent methyltransferase [Aminobacter ciceronei]|uniref:Ubiquinone/menaquinone biosynthesis C-methylase UbiE n=1 Tax=Aminobacter ciceronei TaxID=150723 RepID=A0ABR6C8M0_9HYPH|nr:class I SAM-dependent methyltransferase [Aminobacter ciceronei]MBA8907538.1 ubiquinone/menaquinone biosynthesis C-methylase UbiE [Aminobacter ciceronei]MBA9021361.1 ubiquinone/menaquinone biosynthesis C-methylase UbiE [Aminobacter ciceronei]